ncbi:hypothetical protein SELMODRAFT_448206 [Selaginella moellendorffii]|uniref:VQ domain-containing protein n=1 Tax=Selaginella moellendorffii TaxID=88036 RepID=D8T5J1_SELML|nr:VQ motif-containing protein 11 [Selaginella moellendorffii]EFJ08092.1 hypothetical protein SELMODRAFT_448206 [Selaginella moellendorffii]|eukprot:XP_002990819.1 VQ motif-containing protein 11 [Selaginella moellendorffii]
MERPTPAPNSRENLELDDCGSSSWEMGSSTSNGHEESKVRRTKRGNSKQAIAIDDHTTSKRSRKANSPSSSSGKNRGAENSAPTAVASSDFHCTATTFVQADASSFRDLVQRLTGASDDSIKMPITKASGQGRPNLSSKRSQAAMKFFQQGQLQHPPKHMVIKALPSKKNLFLKNAMTDLLSPKSPLSLALNSSPSSSASSSSSSSRHQRELPAAMNRMFLQLESPRPSSKLELLPLFPMR